MCVPGRGQMAHAAMCAWGLAVSFSTPCPFPGGGGGDDLVNLKILLLVRVLSCRTVCWEALPPGSLVF